MGRIWRLSDAVVRHLRSNSVVSGFEQAVEELVCNSLDAGATQVRVQVDEGGASVKVEDDGHGISRDDLELVGVRHATSKLRTLNELEAGIETLGFRGEALSSLSDISILEITTRVQGCPHSYCKIMKSATIKGHNSHFARCILQSTCSKKTAPFQPSKANAVCQGANCKLGAGPSGCLFHLNRLSEGEEGLHIRRHTSLVGTLQDIFGCERCQGLQEVDFSKGGLRLSGFLSKTHAHTSSKAIQYMYINHRFVHKTPLRKLLNRWGKTDAHPSGAQSRRTGKPDTSLGRQEYPAFVLNLSCPLSDYDITFEASKTYVEFKDWTYVLSFLEKVLWTMWGDEAGKKDASKASGKRKSCCRTDGAKESSFEIKEESKRASIRGVKDEIWAAPLVGVDSVCVPRVRSLWKDASAEIGFGDSLDDYHFRSDLERNISWSPAWRPSMEPAIVHDEADWLDTDLNPQLHLKTDRAFAHAVPICASDVLCPGSSHAQAVLMASSPLLSDGSWECDLDVCREVDDYEVGEVSSPKYLNLNFGQLQPSIHSRGPDSNHYFQELPGALSLEPWISPPTSKADYKSMACLWEGAVDDDWMLATPTPPLNLLLSPGRVWDQPHRIQLPESLSTDEQAANSCSDVEETQFQGDLQRCSGRHQKSGCAFEDEEFDAQEDFPLQASPEQRHAATVSGESVLELNTKLASEQVTDIQEVINTEDLKGTLQGGESCEQDRACTTALEAHLHELHLSKFRIAETTTGHLTEELSKNEVASMYKVWLNPCMRANTNDILDLTAGLLGSSSNSLQPEMITKESLQHARVLQQVDTKFIAVVAQSVLLLVDQKLGELSLIDVPSIAHSEHAADERVRLEEFRAHVLATEKQQCSANLDGKHELALGLSEQQTLHTYRQQIEDWGWRFQTASDTQDMSKNAGRDGMACNFQLTAVPCILGVNLTAADLEEYLQQLGATHGASVPPPAVVRLLNYKSCRGAIMFGDSLLPSECRQLVNHLKRTALCFQCAHGRPTMVPLVDLSILRQRFETHISNTGVSSTDLSGWNNVQKTVRSADETVWHKLVHYPVSLQRARERLNQLKHT